MLRWLQLEQWAGDECARSGAEDVLVDAKGDRMPFKASHVRDQGLHAVAAFKLGW